MNFVKIHKNCDCTNNCLLSSITKVNNRLEKLSKNLPIVEQNGCCSCKFLLKKRFIPELGEYDEKTFYCNREKILDDCFNVLRNKVSDYTYSRIKTFIESREVQCNNICNYYIPREE